MRQLREGLLVVGTTALLVGITLSEGRTPHSGLPVLAAVSVAVSLPLLLRRRLPLTAATLSAAMAVLGSTIPGWPGRLVAMAALGCAAYHRPLRLPSVLVVSVVWVLVYAAMADKAAALSTIADLIVLGVAVPAAGYALRLQRDRAEQTVRLHLAEADRVAAEDRGRLARDVHDSVGHHLTAIRLQAMAARRALGGTPALADRVLGTINELSSSALGEVRALLTTLGTDAGAPPGLADVEQLVQRLAGPDRRISLRSDDATALPPAVDHTAYRVVQEALTNAVRHATATEIEVSVRRDRHGLDIVVTDNGITVPEPGQVAEGHGIRGMRERVRSLGGTVSIGPRLPHGWSVRATLPIERGRG